MKLLELLSISNKEEILLAKSNKEFIQILWDNGNIFLVTPKNLEGFSFTSISLQINFKSKSILFWPMDDRSDFRFIKRLQQALKDLIKGDIVDETYSVKISSERSTIKNIGSLNIKDVIDYDSSFDKSIPIVFHGTSTKNLPIIKKYGLVPPNTLIKMGLVSKRNFNKFYTQFSMDSVYLTIDYDVAVNYAQNAAQISGGDPIIIIIKNLSIDNIDTDDDLLNNVGFAQLLLTLSGNKGYKHYIDSIKANSQIRYTGRIPPSKIFKIERI